MIKETSDVVFLDRKQIAQAFRIMKRNIMNVSSAIRTYSCCLFMSVARRNLFMRVPFDICFKCFKVLCMFVDVALFMHSTPVF